MNSPFSFLTLPVIIRPGLEALFCARARGGGEQDQHGQQQQQVSQFHRFGALPSAGETAPADLNLFDFCILRTGARHRSLGHKDRILIFNSKTGRIPKKDDFFIFLLPAEKTRPYCSRPHKSRLRNIPVHNAICPGLIRGQAGQDKRYPANRICA